MQWVWQPMPDDLAYVDLEQPEADLLLGRYATQEDHAAAGRYRKPLRARQSLVARALLRAMLGDRDWRILAGPGGAPVLEHPDGTRPPFISISHSNMMVACALSRAGRIGVDIEQARAARPVAAIADTVFGSDERDRVVRYGAAEFYRIWTLREALAKATGAGFPLVVGKTDLVPAGPDPTRCRLGETGWTLGHWALPGDYTIGLAIEAESLPKPVRFVLNGN
jgi:4'-phosphopantetheinyl transferase